MFQKAYDQVEVTIVPLLSGWLQYPRDGAFRALRFLLHEVANRRCRQRSRRIWANTGCLSPGSYTCLQHSIEFQRSHFESRFATEEYGLGRYNSSGRF